MSTTCRLCGSPLADDARVVSVRLEGVGAVPSVEERERAPDGAVACLCAEHADAVRLLRELCPDTDEVEGRVRGFLYQELDLLAYALEMEAAEALADGDEAEALRAQRTRLGIRLAQRLVGGVPAPEVDERLGRWRESWESKFPSSA